MNRMLALASGLFAATILAAPVAAVINTQTYSGTVTGGFDETGEFGPATNALAGKSFVARFTYDTDIGTRYTTAATDGLYGGFNQSTINPVTHATVNIGGVLRTIDLHYYTGAVSIYGVLANTAPDIYTYSGFSQAQVGEDDTYRFQDDTFYGNSIYGNALFAAPIMPMLGNRFTTAASGYFQVSLSAARYGHGYTNHAFLQADITSFTVGDAVPEPATWGLMIGGLAAVGIATRRRRALAVG